MKRLYRLGMFPLLLSVGLSGALEASVMARPETTPAIAQSNDKPSNDKPSNDKPSSDKPRDDKTSDDKPSDDKPKTANQLTRKIRKLYRRGDYEAAIPLAEQVLVLYKQQLQPTDPKISEALGRLAELYNIQNRTQEAEALYREAIKIDRQVVPPEESSLSVHLTRLARLLQTQGRYTEAESLFQEVVTRFREKYPEPHIALASPLVNLAGIKEVQGHYDETEALLQEVLAIARKKYKRRLGIFPKSPTLAKVLNNLAEFYHTQGRYAEAEPLYKEAHKIAGKARFHGANAAIMASIYPTLYSELSNNLASLYQSQGRYLEAEPLLKKAIKFARKQKQPIRAVSQSELALLYQTQGRNAEAEQLLKEALEIARDASAPTDPTLKSIGNTIASKRPPTVSQDPLVQQIGGLMWDILKPNAGSLYVQFHTFTRKGLPEKHPELISVLRNLATFYRMRDRHSEAEPLLLEALDIARSTLPENHPTFAIVLNDLAAVYQSQRRHTEAEPFLQESLKIANIALPSSSPTLASILNNQAMLYRAKQDTPRMLQALESGLNIEEANLIRNLVVGDESQRKAFLSLFQNSTNAAISAHQQLAPTSLPAAQLALTTLLRRKGRLQDVLGQGFLRVRESANPEVKEQLTELTKLQAQISQQVTHSSGVVDEKKLSQLTEQETELLATLSRASAELDREFRPVTIKQVQEQLPPDAALMEFVIYQPLNLQAKSQKRGQSPRYAVYVLQPQGDVRWADLGPVSEIQPLVKAVTSQIQNISRPVDQIRPALQALETRIMQPIRPLLGDARHLLVAPDGELNRIPFEALVDVQGRYLLQSYQFTYLTSGRDLLRLQDPLPEANAPLLLAFPTYDQRGRRPDSDAIAQAARQRSTELANLQLEPLQNTLVEGRAIAQLFPQFQVFQAAEATETVVKQSPNPSLLHIATHGFFLNNTDSASTNDSPREQPNENPLLRSGLALAGFNLRDGGSKRDDGVLTALEVSGLDLRATQMVVMSACETGVGQVERGEGVYGLRRAFTLAGARSQLMSLWTIDDAGTKDLMVAYYSRLKQGQGRGEALRAVQMEMLAGQLSGQNGISYRHPYYWAAFVRLGDWRPLQGL